MNNARGGGVCHFYLSNFVFHFFCASICLKGEIVIRGDCSDGVAVTEGLLTTTGWRGLLGPLGRPTTLARPTDSIAPRAEATFTIGDCIRPRRASKVGEYGPFGESMEGSDLCEAAAQLPGPFIGVDGFSSSESATLLPAEVDGGGVVAA